MNPPLAPPTPPPAAPSPLAEPSPTPRPPPPSPPAAPTPPPDRALDQADRFDWPFEGIASWYGPGFDGRTTASGEPFDQGALTAAHATLPFGTLVRVTNLRSQRSVVVRINDRPGYRDRIIDLSRAAANALGMVLSGTARVRLAVLER